MKRRYIINGIIIMCLMLALGLLSACGVSSPVGTWHEQEDNSESFYNFDEDGIVTYYNADYDELSYGTWEEIDGLYEVYGFTGGAMKCKMKTKNKLYCDDFDATFKRGEERDLPSITITELIYDSWVTDDKRYELEFYSSNTWDLYDYDVDEYLMEGDYEIEDGDIIMEDVDGNFYIPTVTENRNEITVFDDVFIHE